jgi:lactococcin 972 family bacteriocin
LKLKRVLTTSAVAAAFVVGVAAPAMAVSVGGGTWNYGVVDGSHVWSDYYHGSSCHTASVDGAYFVRDYASAGYWAQASAPDTIWVDEAYWNNRC